MDMINILLSQNLLGDVDMVFLQEEYKNMILSLNRIGLTDYEAKVFIALVAAGYSTAEEVARMSSIPRTSAYKVLDSLREKGFISTSRGRPKLFTPIDIAQIKKEIMSDIESSFSKLELVKELIHERGVPQLIYTISGKERVRDKIIELFDNAGDRILLSSPSMKELGSRITGSMRMAGKRGINVSVVTRPFQRLPGGVHAKFRKGLIATDIVIDGKYALVASKGLIACGYSDNPGMAQHLENFLYIMLSD